MTRSAPEILDYQVVCKDCGTEWRPLYETMTELLKNARCPECHAQDYDFEGVTSISELYTSHESPSFEQFHR